MASTGTSTTTTMQTQPTNHARTQRGHRGRGRGNTAGSTQKPPTDTLRATGAVTSAVSEMANEASICWICAEPVKYYSVSECDHRTCHVCTLRLRALYKKTECTFCKSPQTSVIFTVSPDALFSSFTPDRIPYKDQKLSIYFESKDMMEETVVLLRFNCPDTTCDYSATGWSDLKLHVRGIHNKMMCDLCIRNKRVFSHEHALYSSIQLASHLPSMRHRGHKLLQKDQIEGGVHPLCEFCHECFFDDEQLFPHMRERHEECFICKRNNINYQYFLNYDSLEKHFHDSHQPCTHPECLLQKFVVFDSPLDLKAHMVEVHGAAMTSRDKKDARRIQADFEFEDLNLPGRNARPRRGEGAEPRYSSTRPPGTGTRTNGTSQRREGFVATLTGDGGRSTSGPGHHISPPPPPWDCDNERHQVLVSRLQSLVLNSSTTQRAVEAAIRSFSVAESRARDLISTVWNISDQKLEETASIINAAVDFLEEEDKKRDLLSSWNNFKIEQRQQFPDLVPIGQDTGWAEIASGRVLNVKHSTASRTAQQSSRQVWDRVARAANSSAAFPVLKPPDRPQSLPPLAGPSSVPMPRQGQRNTPWVSSTRAAASYPPITSQNESPNKGSTSNAASGTPPMLSDTLFPELPTSRRPKPVVKGNLSLRNIRGDSTPVASAWGARSGDGATSTEDEMVPESKRKKGKGKQRQTLFTFGISG